MKIRARNILGPVAVGALACSAFVAVPAFAAEGVNGDDNGLNVTQGALQNRVSGIDRFGTAVAASKALQTEGPRDTVLLANYLAWSDTLAATPLADAVNATVLYSYADSLEGATAKELARLKEANGGSLNVILLGGEGVLTPGLAATLTKGGYNVDRIGGDDRYESALLLAAEAVDYYEGTSRLADARGVIRGLEAAESAYQDAVAAWNKARTATNSAFHSYVAAQANVAAAQKALDAAVDAIVVVPGAPTQEELDDAATAVAEARATVSDIRTVEGFVSDRLVTYAGGVGTDFQNDAWTDVEAFFGSQEFTITVAGDEFTGTLAELSDEVPYLSTAAAAEGATTTVKAVQENLETQGDAAVAAAETANVTYANLVAAWVDAAKAAEINAAQLKKVAAAQEALKKAQEAFQKAAEKYEAAADAEAEAKADAAAAAANRPTGEALSAANLAHEAALKDVLDDATAYPAFLATGTDFADALAAGPAAAEETGVVLLTQGATVPASTQRYLDADPNEIAVGGPAAAAVPGASKAYVGADRYETATALAAAYFTDPYDYVGLASGTVAADAVVGGALLANVDGTIVLSNPNALPKTTADFLSYSVEGPILVPFGGPAALSNQVLSDAEQALKN